VVVGPLIDIVVLPHHPLPPVALCVLGASTLRRSGEVDIRLDMSWSSLITGWVDGGERVFPVPGQLMGRTFETRSISKQIRLV
jgi:hypothetical protein